MKSLPFSKPGRWYRGNLHTHSTNSDGTKSPAQVCAIYRRRGYDFLSLTDHFEKPYGWPISDTRPYRTKGFTTLIGAELHAPRTSLGERWHILAVGLPRDFAVPGKRERGPQLAQRAAKTGAYVAVAHPAWYDLSDEDILSVKAARAIEIFNSTCQVHNGAGDSTGYLDRLLARGHRYHAIATDDAHFLPDRPDHAKNWVVVRCRHLEPAALLSALHAGHFYSSQGPQILDVRFTGRGARKVSIRTSGVRAIRINGRSSQCLCARFSRDTTSAQFDLARFRDSYARITVVDRQGRRAWTNPFWL